MFDCPNCHVDLQKAEGNPGVYWRCPACGGRAATVSLLRRLIPREIMNALWQTAWSGSYPRRRDCPACGRPMAEVPAGDESTRFTLDLCTLCQTVWFDAEEYESLPKKIREVRTDERLPPEAREQLAILKIREIQQRAEAGSDDAEWWQWIVGFFGLPVESEASGESARAWGTWTVAAAVLGVSLLCLSDVASCAARFGFIPAEYGRLGGLTLLTSFFIHAGALHLLGNLYFLLAFGDNVEQWLGWKKFLLLLLTATVAGDLLHMALNMESTLPCIGASGGISGVLAFYALQFPRARLRVLIRYWMRFGWIRVPAWVFFVFWLILQYFAAGDQIEGVGNVAALAHLGGVLAGLLFWLASRRTAHDMSCADPVDFIKEIERLNASRAKSARNQPYS